MKLWEERCKLVYIGVLVFFSLCFFAGNAQYAIQAWGNNSMGQFGNGTLINSISPLPAAAGGGLPFITLSSGSSHTLGIRSDGSLWAWGLNADHQLGDGTTDNRTLPLNIYSGQWLTVAAGIEHSIGIQTNGSLWAWGRNTSYQLGDGTYVPFRDIPTRIDFGTGNTWTAVSAGAYHTIGLRADGSIWSWGLNNYLQLGDGTIFSGRNYPSMIQSGSPLKFTQIAAGYNHTLALGEDGSLWGWGANNSGQLGDGTLQNRGTPFMIVQGSGNPWKCITAGEGFSAGIRADGSLWAWGSSIPGLAGGLIPSQMFTGDCIRWTKMTAGKDFIIAMKEDGTIWSFGHNEEGQLGNGTTINSVAPEQIMSLGYISLNNALAAGKSYAIIAGEKLTGPLVSGGPKDTSFTACILQGTNYTIGDTSFSTPGTHTVTLLTQQRCDSVVRVTLAVIEPLQRDSSIYACDSFRFKQNVYYNNTILSDTVRSATGCDSIYYTIALRINRSTVSQKTACLSKGSTYSFNGSILTKSGLYVNTYATVQGCDSIVQLHLVIAKDTIIDIRGAGFVEWNNTTYVASTFLKDTVFSLSGCDSLYRNINIQVSPAPNTYIPNAFTPNDDGLNDIFRPSYSAIKKLYWFRIYNRYGQLVFETTRSGLGWNGTVKGVLQPIGTYIWMLKAEENTGKNIEKTGSVLLLY